MRLPRLSGIETSLLRRLRVQQLAIGIVWTIFAVVRFMTATEDSSWVFTAVVIILAIGFFAFALLAHLEVRRRVREDQP
jgi:uncharacterized membrane protein YdjX (TVP38/TMEM64 family)